MTRWHVHSIPRCGGTVVEYAHDADALQCCDSRYGASFVHSLHYLCVSIRRRDRHNQALLQQRDLCRRGAATRWAVHLDTRDKDLPIRPATAHRPVASRSRERTLLLCDFNLPCHRLARDAYRYDGVEPVKMSACALIFTELDGRRHVSRVRETAEAWSGKFLSDGEKIMRAALN